MALVSICSQLTIITNIPESGSTFFQLALYKIHPNTCSGCLSMHIVIICDILETR